MSPVVLTGIKVAAYGVAAFVAYKAVPAGMARTVSVVILAAAAVRTAVRPLPVVGPLVGADV
jgi:hypothetical protein